MKDKVQRTEELIERLKRIAANAVSRAQYEEALSALSACAHVLYEYNQRYKDDEIENLLLEISEKVVDVPADFERAAGKKVQTVLFYDGFGLDLRGLAIKNARYIVENGYKLIYVTSKQSKDKQPYLHKELLGYDVVFAYVDMQSNYMGWIGELNGIFNKYRPEAAFLYTQPNDVAGVTVFNKYADYVTRFQIDLTDHAFWIGLNAFDFTGNSRPMGAYIQHCQRGIPIEKMMKVRSSLYINEHVERKPLPFDIAKYKYVFGGGALYKTLGDPNNTYYRFIEHIVSHYDDINFVYAGSGDRSEFDKLIEKYPGRVFLLDEREDFYQIIQGCLFYLNTYPMFGGLMMRYAAYAGKIPVTLRHNNDSDGLIEGQAELGIEFDTYEDVIAEIDRVIADKEYRAEKEKRLAAAVFTREQEIEMVRNRLENHATGFELTIEEFDTTKFRQEYLERLDYDKLLTLCIPKVINKPLLKYFPMVFIKRFVAGVKKRL